MLIVLEGLIMCFILLLVCVIGIKNGPVGLVCMYEKDVQERCIELGLTTKEKIKKATILSSIFLYGSIIILVPLMVYFINGTRGFWNLYFEMVIIILIMGLFDRLFVDWYWVGHTKAWEIKGTEDLKPYIPTKTLIGKWLVTLVGFPIITFILTWIIELFELIIL